MNFNICTNTIMAIIKDIDEYIRLSLSPTGRMKPSYNTLIFDTFYTYFNDMYRKHGFCNIFIEDLIKQ